MRNHVPRLGSICPWARRRWIKRAPLRAGWQAKQASYGPLQFAVIKRYVRSARISDRIKRRREAGYVAKVFCKIFRNAQDVMQKQGKLVLLNLYVLARNVQKTRGGVAA